MQHTSYKQITVSDILLCSSDKIIKATSPCKHQGFLGEEELINHSPRGKEKRTVKKSIYSVNRYYT